MASASPHVSADQSQVLAEPLTVRIELVVVDGPAGEELFNRQAAVVYEALQWFAGHRRSEYGQEAGGPAAEATAGRPATRTPHEGEQAT
jgi:hypothetical protein